MLIDQIAWEMTQTMRKHIQSKKIKESYGLTEEQMALLLLESVKNAQADMNVRALQEAIKVLKISKKPSSLELQQGRPGTARNGGPGDLWHGPARKIMARKNIGTARHGKSWHGKILARHGTKNQTHFLWVKNIFRNLVQFFMGEKYFQEFGPSFFMGEKYFQEFGPIFYG